MTHRSSSFLAFLSFLLLLLPAAPFATASGRTSGGTELKVLAVETFLADIARGVAGERVKVEALLPIGADPHGFEPTPADVARVADCNVLVVHGAGVEEFLDELLHNAGGVRRIIEASAGLEARATGEDEAGEDHGEHHDKASHHEGHRHHHETDPHFWLSPVNVVTYVTNIRDGLSQADPAGAATYAANADGYIEKLKELDGWIAEQVKRIPEKGRLLVTNHESFGYYADRYGFQVIGTILPGVSTGASPSARELARLARRIKATGAKAIFLETGSNPRLAAQIAKEAGIKAVTELYTHSVTEPDGPAPTYIEMMRFNTTAIVSALK